MKRLNKGFIEEEQLLQTLINKALKMIGRINIYFLGRKRINLISEP